MSDSTDLPTGDPASRHETDSPAPVGASDASPDQPPARRPWTLAEDAPDDFLGPLLIVGLW